VTAVDQMCITGLNEATHYGGFTPFVCDTEQLSGSVIVIAPQVWHFKTEPPDVDIETRTGIEHQQAELDVSRDGSAIALSTATGPPVGSPIQTPWTGRSAGRSPPASRRSWSRAGSSSRRSRCYRYDVRFPCSDIVSWDGMETHSALACEPFGFLTSHW
jgi:hypothetical protein